MCFAIEKLETKPQNRRCKSSAFDQTFLDSGSLHTAP
jgi:hypothetical protein